VVNAARSYHHGSLRQTLLDAAAAQVQTVGPAQLSLRELARRAGVSHAAPAHHFRDKRGLFTAVAAEGFRLLAQRTVQALTEPNALIEAGRHYVEFALDQPGYFAVMFDVSLLDINDLDYQRQRDHAFEILYEAIRRATNVVDDSELAAQTIAAWAAVHGAATLWLSGNLPYERDSSLVSAAILELAPALARIATVSAVQAAQTYSRAEVHRVHQTSSTRAADTPPTSKPPAAAATPDRRTRKRR
jgi:AcrR family transcriptional regulator